MADGKNAGQGVQKNLGPAAYIAGFWPGPDSNPTGVNITLKGWVRPALGQGVSLVAELVPPAGNPTTVNVTVTGNRFTVAVGMISTPGEYYVVVSEDNSGILKPVAGCAFYVHQMMPVV